MIQEQRQITKQTIEYKTVYISNDNKEFDSEEDCRKWENSAIALLFSKLKECTIASDLDTILDECDENQYSTLVPTTQEHLDTINQLHFMFGGKSSKEEIPVPIVGTEDLGMPVLLRYRFCCNEIDWVWLYKVSTIVNRVTNGEYKLKPVE